MLTTRSPGTVAEPKRALRQVDRLLSLTRTLENRRWLPYHCRRCCADVIGHACGFIAKYMGDGVLDYFGYPAAHENEPSGR